jgi:hypothetical protein
MSLRCPTILQRSMTMTFRSKASKFFNNVLYYAILGLIGLLIAAFFVGMFLLKQWRWSCG